MIGPVAPMMTRGWAERRANRTPQMDVQRSISLTPIHLSVFEPVATQWICISNTNNETHKWAIIFTFATTTVHSKTTYICNGTFVCCLFFRFSWHTPDRVRSLNREYLAITESSLLQDGIAAKCHLLRKLVNYQKTHTYSFLYILKIATTSAFNQQHCIDERYNTRMREYESYSHKTKSTAYLLDRRTWLPEKGRQKRWRRKMQGTERSTRL